jgi:hypothetical protein
MAQQAVRTEFQPSPGMAGLSIVDLDELGQGWVILRDCRLRPGDRGSSPTVLIHPARGVAVLDFLPFETPDALDAVRNRLDAACFPEIFAGELPVVHLRLTPRQMLFLPALLDDTFDAQPPLRLPGGDAWVGAAKRALLVEQRVSRLERRPADDPTRDGRPRRRRRPAVLRQVGAVLLCLAALGGVLALVRPDVPAPAAPMPDAVPAAVADVMPALPIRSVPGEVAAQEAAVPAAPSPIAESVVVALPPPAPPFQVPSERAAAPEPRQPAPVVPPVPAAAKAPPVVAPPPRAPPPRAAAPASTARRSGPIPPPAKKALPERPAPRRQKEARTAGTPQAGVVAAAPPLPEASPERCRRVSALVGSGAPIGDADIRFFNEACIRW